MTLPAACSHCCYRPSLLILPPFSRDRSPRHQLLFHEVAALPSPNPLAHPEWDDPLPPSFTRPASFECQRRIAGWGLVRTHAADAACVLPRPATSSPFGAALLTGRAPPDRTLLGDEASRSVHAEASTRRSRWNGLLDGCVATGWVQTPQSVEESSARRNSRSTVSSKAASTTRCRVSKDTNSSWIVSTAILAARDRGKR
jgi:hypothetical protein